VILRVERWIKANVLIKSTTIDRGIFGTLNKMGLSEIAGLCTVCEVDADTTIFQEGQTSTDFYFVGGGQVLVSSKGEDLAVLRAGEEDEWIGLRPFGTNQW